MGVELMDKLNAAQHIQQNPAGFTVEACEAEIKAALDRYQCQLVFVGIAKNGIPAGGQFVVEPRTAVPPHKLV